MPQPVLSSSSTCTSACSTRWTPSDAVCSRTPANLEIGLARARQAGAVITATETVVFQLLGLDDTDAFRDLGSC